MKVRDHISSGNIECRLVYRNGEPIGYKMITTYSYYSGYSGYNSKSRTVKTILTKGEKAFVYEDYKNYDSHVGYSAYRHQGVRVDKEYVDNCIYTIIGIFEEEDVNEALKIFTPRIEMLSFYKLGPKREYKHPLQLKKEAKEKRNKEVPNKEKPKELCEDPQCSINRKGQRHQVHINNDIIYT